MDTPTIVTLAIGAVGILVTAYQECKRDEVTDKAMRVGVVIGNALTWTPVHSAGGNCPALHREVLVADGGAGGFTFGVLACRGGSRDCGL
jgi:hypothetical protein